MPNDKLIPMLTDAEEAELQARIATDPDAREMTDEELAAMRPASEVLPPALYAALTKRGRPKSEAPKVAISLRVDPAVLDAYKATGDGWQTRMHEILAQGVTQL